MPAPKEAFTGEVRGNTYIHTKDTNTTETRTQQTHPQQRHILNTDTYTTCTDRATHTGHTQRERGQTRNEGKEARALRHRKF
jgi:hypothetical protein